jgi:hypothetical protein
VTSGSNPKENTRPDHCLEIYKLAVEMADRVSARRASANNFFFSLQAGIVVALGAFAINTGAPDDPQPDRFVLTLAAIGGAVIAASWWMLLRSYRDLNSAKFAVINRIERDHLDIALFSDEWDELKKDPVKAWRPRYAEQGAVERVVPLLFLVLYASLAIYIVLS